MGESYFSVGEEVILCSKMHPECNGDATVLGVFPSNFGIDSAGNRCSYGYTLTIPNPNPSNWSQNALRKKPKPYNGEQFDFSDEDCPYEVEEKV